jgi:ubiquinone/menaquinone biosynthesis C-methylase UbiE
MNPSIAGHTQQLAADFDRVAARYDLLQRFNPGYRADLLLSAKRLAAPPFGRVLDVCCGTGLSTQALRELYPNSQITAIDNSVGMLSTAQAKPSLAGVRFIVSDAMALHESEASDRYDGILMAYGIRNVSDPDRCLASLRDQLVPGGRLALHEYSVAGSLTSRVIWNAVAASVIVPLGAALTGSPTLFRYLRRSVNDFDSIERLEARMRSAGFVNVQTSPMNGWRRGIVHTVLGERPTD